MPQTQVQEQKRERLKETLAALREQLRRLAELDSRVWGRICELADDALAFLARYPGRFALRFSTYGDPPRLRAYILGASGAHYARYDDARDATVQQVLDWFFSEPDHLAEILCGIAEALKAVSRDVMDRIRMMESKIAVLERALEGLEGGEP